MAYAPALIRVARWAWPLIFLLPLTWFAGRGCDFPGVDATYHSVLWLHENLPALYLAIGSFAAITVIVRVVRVRARASALFELAGELPPALSTAFCDAAASLKMPLPQIAYLDVDLPLCFALLGARASIVVSRGFIAGLQPAQLRLVAHHELLHVRHHDPTRGLVWHLVFAAFLLPAFGQLERWLANRRELRTNLKTAVGEPDLYADLLRLKAGGRRALCVEALPSALHAGRLSVALVAPVFVLVVLSGLVFSHAWFLGHLEFLTTHHC